MLRALEGAWAGSGTLLGCPGSFTMTWTLGPAGFARSTAIPFLFLALGATGTAGQERSSRSLGLILSQSVSSATAAGREGGYLTLPTVDVLEPVSVSFLEVELTVRLHDAPSWGLDYAARALPLALVRNNPRDAAVRGPGGWRMSLDSPRASTLGVGVKPVGLRAWAGNDRLRAEVETAAGAVHFGSAALASNATRLNFVYEFGLGLRLRFPGAQVAVGFRRHHLSNAGLGEVNPGLNSHMGYLGLWLD